MSRNTVEIVDEIIGTLLDAMKKGGLNVSKAYVNQLTTLRTELVASATAAEPKKVTAITGKPGTLNSKSTKS